MMISYNSLLKVSRIFIKDYFMKNFKSALDRFEAAKTNLRETLDAFDTKNNIASKEELKSLKEKNLILNKTQSEAKEKINKLIIKIDKILESK